MDVLDKSSEQSNYPAGKSACTDMCCYFFQCTRVVLVSHLMCWILLLKISCRVLLRYVRLGFFLSLLLFRVQYDYNLQFNTNNFPLFTILHNLQHSNTVHCTPYSMNTLFIHSSTSIYPLIYRIYLIKRPTSNKRPPCK